MENIHQGFTLHFSSTALEILLLKKWNKQTLPAIIKNLSSCSFNAKKISIDFSKLESCDACSMIYLISLIEKFKKTSLVELKNMEKFDALYQLYLSYYTASSEDIKKKTPFEFIESLGIYTLEIYHSTLRVVHFMGQVSYFFVLSLFNPTSIRFKSMLNHIETSALNALFIIAITSFLVGIVIAYQGSVQLSKFGANIFIVEMVSITMFREIAPLMTAIVIAGRTASSYTAEIGAMKITEEIDAMKTMGFEPTVFITLPRVFALIFTLPLLIFFSDIVSVFAGSVVAFLDLNISFSEFFNRMKDTVELRHFLIGIFKGVFFGIAIAMIGCYRGFQVQNNTTSIGKYTTISVVNAIFIVIALNAIFSVILTQSGL